MVCGWCMLLDNHCIAIAADLHAMVFCVWRWRYNFFLPGEYLPLASWRFRFTCGLNVLYGAECGSATTVSPKGWKNGHHVYYFRHINTHIYTYTDELIAFLGVWTWCVCVFACVQSKNKILRTRERSEAFSLIYLYLCTVWPNNNGKYVVIHFFLSPSKRHFPFPAACPVYRSIVKIASFLSPPTIHSLTIWISCLLYIFHWLRLALFCHGIQQSNIFVSPPLVFIVAIVHATP